MTFPPLRRIVWAAIVLAAATFAVQGGEYSTVRLYKQHVRKRQLLASIDSLRKLADSLRRLDSAIRTDSATQERIAREQHGMVRGDKELIYRFFDSAAPPRR